MLAEIIEPIATKHGILSPGQVVDLPEEVAERLAEKISPALPNGIALDELKREFAHDPGWEKIKDSPLWLRHLGETMEFRRIRTEGGIPSTYTAERVCTNCGPVWLEPWNPETVEGCPWCLSNGKGTCQGKTNPSKNDNKKPT